MSEDILNGSIRYLKGVGEAKEKLFNKLGIATLRDLAGFFPRAYEDRTVCKKINALTVGENVCVRAMAAAPPVLSHIRKGLDIVKFKAVDETGALEMTFFNAPFIKNTIKQGQSYTFYGKVSGTLIRPEMINPVFDIYNGNDVSDETTQAGVQTQAEPETSGKLTQTGCIVPIYPLTAKLTQKAVATAVGNMLAKCGDNLPDVIPDEIEAEFKLCRNRYAYQNIHFPASFKDLDIARRRLIFEELFVLVTAMRLMRKGRVEKTGLIITPPDFSELYETLPYTPTGAQLKAINDIVADMSSGKMMNRLIQGDVGCGKTLVAAACAWAVFKSSAQSAFMAPTEILAKQHFASLTGLLAPLGVTVGLLTGSMTAKGKRETYEKLRSGEIDVIVGTHALISEGVEFKKPALVITDEQHRFGVTQRAMLAEKGDSAHILVMSATPIPRTLALIIYGDLSVSVIDEMPPGRTQVETHIIKESHKERAYGFVRKLVGEGRQVFIICPMVSDGQEAPDNTAEDEQNAIKSVIAYHEKLSKSIFPDLKVALVHGKMPAKEKDAAMAAFAEGQADILVATTVVEVGVDVPNAAMILIENADRFGLSQLHQLRGRVGRGAHKSYCILSETPKSEDLLNIGGVRDVNARLQIMKSTNDGFKIAEEDLKLRGPGDFFGSRQHGLPEMRIANLMKDMVVLHEAERAAEQTLKADPHLTMPQHKALSEQIARMFDSAQVT